MNAVATLLHDRLGRKTSMTDADMGAWTYSYNAFGELIQQNTAISGKYTTVAYDLLGRMTNRIDVSAAAQESNATWTYDLGTNALGKLVQEDNTISGSAGVTRAFAYGQFGRPSTVTTTISGNSYTASTTYDQFGRTFQVFDGAETYSGLEYSYNADGHLERAIESRGSASVTTERYRITGKDARGQVTGMNKGGITVSRVFSPDTGRVDSIFAQTLLGTTIQNFSFDFDVLGSLTAKADARRGLSETYSYDGLNRLTSVTGSASLTLNYDGLGNITSKSDVGSYTYTSGGKPHAVTNAGGVGYGYDGNGNLTSGDGRSNSYTVFNKPNSMSQAGNTVSIDYGPNRERFRHIELKSGQTTTTHYVGGFEKIWRPNGVNETKRYLDGEVIVTTRSNGTQDVEYPFTDHLGSTDVITNDAGVIVQSMAFDAFGKRRDPINYSALAQATIFNFDTTHTTKGFTGHEEMDPVGLVHMNGRVYEPRLGRFLSADPFVQDPTDTQSLNRHSYVLNNPLSYVDPSGYFSLGGIISFGGEGGGLSACSNPWACVALVVIEVARYAINNASSSSNNGAAPTVFANGVPSLPSTGCTASNGCILNAAADANAQADPIAGASSSGYSTQTGGNFENGAETYSYAAATNEDLLDWERRHSERTRRDRWVRVPVPGHAPFIDYDPSRGSSRTVGHQPDMRTMISFAYLVDLLLLERRMPQTAIEVLHRVATGEAIDRTVEGTSLDRIVRLRVGIQRFSIVQRATIRVLTHEVIYDTHDVGGTLRGNPYSLRWDPVRTDDVLLREDRKDVWEVCLFGRCGLNNFEDW